MDQELAEPTTADRPSIRRPSSPRTGSRLRRAVVVLVVLLLGAAGVKWGARAYTHSLHFESTDDAFIEAHVIPIDPRVASYVKAVHVHDNQEVKAGQLLLELDPRDFQARVESAQAQLASSQAQVTQAKARVSAADAEIKVQKARLQAAQAELKRAQFDLHRLEALPTGAAAPTELVDAQAAAETAESNVAADKQAVDAAVAQQKLAEAQVGVSEADVQKSQAALDQAQLQLSYTKIVAPQAGRVTHKQIEPGAYVTVGQPMFAIVPSQVWVRATFKENDLTYMRPGQPVTIRVDAYPGRVWHGHVDSIQAGTGARFSLLPPENATGNYVKVVQRVPVKILFDDYDDSVMLGAGMSVVPEVKVR